MRLFCGQYDTPIGRLCIYASDDCLYAVSFAGEHDVKTRVYLARNLGSIDIAPANVVTEKTAAQIGEYLNGIRSNFDLKYKLFLSDFAAKVADCILSIPYGESLTYLDIARKIGSPAASRAVGNALNHNPIPIIIPCHRVNARDGMLSGYAGGTKIKRRLLELEQRVTLVNKSDIVSTDEIINPSLTAYVRSLRRNVFRQDILDFANKNNIPVSKPETLDFIAAMFTVRRPRTILEIGTAVGYGTLFMRSVSNAKIYTIEKDAEMFNKAREYFAGSDIQSFLADGVEYMRTQKDKFDFIYVDCAKSQYINLYENVKNALTENGCALFDNVLYKGISAGLGVVKHKNRTIAKNLISFNQNALCDSDVQASLLTVGDGLLLIAKKGESHE